MRENTYIGFTTCPALFQALDTPEFILCSQQLCKLVTFSLLQMRTGGPERLNNLSKITQKVQDWDLDEDFCWSPCHMEAQKYPLSSSFLVSHPSWEQLLSTVVDPTAKVSSLVRGSCSREEGACVIWLLLPTTSLFKFLPPKETRLCSFQILKKKVHT